MFDIGHGPGTPLEELASILQGSLLARLDDLWLVASGPALVLLDTADGEPAPRHVRVGEMADRLRRELFELLTVAPFVESLVVVPGDVTAGPAEVPADLVRHLVAAEPPDPLIARVVALIDEGLLSLPWRRHRRAPVAG